MRILNFIGKTLIITCFLLLAIGCQKTIHNEQPLPKAPPNDLELTYQKRVPLEQGVEITTIFITPTKSTREIITNKKEQGTVDIETSSNYFNSFYYSLSSYPIEKFTTNSLQHDGEETSLKISWNEGKNRLEVGNSNVQALDPEWQTNFREIRSLIETYFENMATGNIDLEY